MDLPNLYSDLLVRPRHQEGESPWGFWLRIANENGLRRPQWLLAPGARWACGTARFCPDCLRAADAVWRSDWEDPQSYWCSRHEAWLVDTCGSCHRRLQWNEVRFLECRCGQDLRKTDSVEVQVRVRTCAAKHAISLIELRILGAFSLYGSIGKPGKKVYRTRLDEVKSQLLAGADVVEDWPTRFVEALDRHRIREAKDGVAQLLVQAFPRLTGLGKLIPKGVWRRRVQDAIDSYCGASLASSAPIVGRNAVLCTSPMTIMQVATRLGRRYEIVAQAIDRWGDGLRGTRVTAQGRLRRVVSEGDLPNLTSFLMEPIAIKTAARLMALPGSRIFAMVRAGLLDQIDGRLVRSQVLSLAVPTPAIQDASIDAQGDCIAVHLALRNWIRVEDTAAFREGDLKAMAAAACPIGEWRTSAVACGAWAKMHRGKPQEELTLSDAAATLGLKHDAVRDLIRAGLLKARIGTVRGRRSWCVTEGDLAAFKSRHVALAVLTRQEKVRSRDGLAWARTQNIQVVTGPSVDGSRQYFVDRSSIPTSNHLTEIGHDENFDSSAWSPELRRALISVRPDFFGVPPDQQLRYRLKLPSKDRQAIVAALLAAHGHRQPAEVAEQASNGDIAAPVQHRINEWLQPLIGLGEDAFSLNESFRVDQSILDFPTLLSYDRDDHEFQEQARTEVEPSHVPRPYAGALNATWARCMLGGRLCYLTLSMAASHIVSRIEDVAGTEIDRIIPHRYMPRPENGRVEDGLVRWSHRVEAGGQESLLEELQRRVWTYANARVLELQTEFNDQPQTGTFLNDDPDPESAEDEQRLRIVFSDPSALAQVRFTSFLSDCRALEHPAEELILVERREADRVVCFVNEQYEELLRTFDANVVPLRQEIKVLIHPGAFDALNSDEDR